MVMSQMAKVEEVTRLGNRYLFPDDTRATIADTFGVSGHDSTIEVEKI